MVFGSPLTRRLGPKTSRFTAKLDLSAEQKEKIAAIDKEFAAKAVEINKASQAILSKEQVAARKAAMQKARSSKDKSPEALSARELGNVGN